MEETSGGATEEGPHHAIDVTCTEQNMHIYCNRFWTGALLDQTGSRVQASDACSCARVNWKEWTS